MVLRIHVPTAARRAAAGAIVATIGCAGPQGASGKHRELLDVGGNSLRRQVDVDAGERT